MPESLTRAQAIRYDKWCQQRWRIPSIVLMTHAAVECATLLRRRAGAQTSQFLALCGSGNNGGDGYAIVRTLASHGLDAIAVQVAPPRTGSDAATMCASAEALGLVRSFPPDSLHHGGLRPVVLIDAIFGTGLTRPPEGAELAAIHWINQRSGAGLPVVAVDIPSGLDCDSGRPRGGPDDAVRANETFTMVAPKAGFLRPGADAYTGLVTVISIGGPADPRLVDLME